MLSILQVETDQHQRFLRELCWEYLSYVNENVQREYQIRFDIVSIIEYDMAHLDIFSPPDGRMFLAFFDLQPAGMIGLRKNKEGIAEIKRMFVRPAFRRRGIARALLDTVFAAAQEIGYSRIRLDSTRFMHEAHALYRSAGFQEIPPYEGSEIPKNFQPHWLFMEAALPPPGGTIGE